MSTIAVNEITKADGSGSLSVPAESGTVVTTASPSLGRRNLIINGAMQVAQRGTSFTSVTDGTYTIDRWSGGGGGSFGTWSVEQSTDAPTGFSNSYKLTCTSSSSLASGSYVRMYSTLEGQDLQHLAFGTSSAKQLTLSFWVKSNKTGSLSAFLRSIESSAQVAGELVSISSADTWEYKTVTINGDTANAFDNDNNGSLQIQFWFNSGSTYSGGTLTNSFTSSAATKYYSTGTLGLGGATSDYVAITGVQLEVGSVATPFEHRSYGEELALCQRYYYMHAFGASKAIGVGLMYTSSQLNIGIYFPVTMRATPTLVSSNNTNDFIVYRNASSTEFNNFLPDLTSNTNSVIYSSVAGGTAGNATMCQSRNSTSRLAFNAEL